MIVLAMALISSNDAILKLSSEELGTGQILFIRGLCASVIFYAFMALGGRGGFSRSYFAPLNIARAVFECIATLCFVTSLALLSIATASTLVWTAPILISISAVLFLGERMSMSRLLAVVVGFAGVVLLTDPLGERFHWAMVLPLVASACVAARDLATRRLQGEVNAMQVVLTTLLVVTVAGGIYSLFDWRPVSLLQVLWLAGGAILLSTGFLLNVIAVRSGELSFISPFLYSGILVATFWGYAIWGEVPGLAGAAGIAMIILSGWYVTRSRTLHEA